MEEGFVGETCHEVYERNSLAGVEGESLDLQGLVRMVCATTFVVIEDGVEAGEPAVVHVRRGDRDVAQGWDFEGAAVRVYARDEEQPRIL